jgi:hypothetical protein
MRFLPGVPRAIVVDVVRDLGLKLELRPFSLEEARRAREAFITSTNNYVLPITPHRRQTGGRPESRTNGQSFARGLSQSHQQGAMINLPRATCSTGTTPWWKAGASPRGDEPDPGCHEPPALEPRGDGDARARLAARYIPGSVRRSLERAEKVFYDSFEAIHLAHLRPLSARPSCRYLSQTLNLYVGVVQQQARTFPAQGGRASRLVGLHSEKWRGRVTQHATSPRWSMCNWRSAICRPGRMSGSSATPTSI